MHWSLAPTVPTVVSVPTGSGKTAIAMAAPHFLDEPPRRILVVVPTRALRDQLVGNFQSQEVLQRIGAMPSVDDFAQVPNVIPLTGRVTHWDELEGADVVVALPNSISPEHYEGDARPPVDLFDLVIIDEAHHAPAPTWTSILDHFASRRALLLTATPVRRDGKRIPGELVYHYPLRRALDEGFYQPVRPVLLDLADPADRVAADAAIAAEAAQLLAMEAHQTSVLLARGGSIARLGNLEEAYSKVGIELTLLHNRMSEQAQREVLDRLMAGEVRAIGVVGMLGEGFDLPSLRIAAYHDKHKSLPATIQLIGRLARVDLEYPQGSVLITARDIDVFPELRGVVRSLYDEDADWAEVLPGIIDDQIQRERDERAFVADFGPAHGDILPDRLQPLQRSVVYEVADTTWRPSFDQGQVPDKLVEGANFEGGRVVYSVVDPEGQLLVIGVQHVSQPRWSSDPGLAETTYSLHLVAFQQSPRTDLPSVLFINADGQTALTELVEILELQEVAHPASPERIGQYIDGLDRRSVSAVGMRTTNAANRGTTTYKNHLGASVDRGLRAIDMTRNALGHVNIQISDGQGSSNAGAALEKAKLWVTRYTPLRAYRDWIEQTATLLWFERSSVSGPLLPALNRGTTLIDWPPAPALAAELNPALLGRGYQIVTDAGELIALEEVELFVAADPFSNLDGLPTGDGLPISAIRSDRDDNEHELLWSGHLRLDGSFAGPPVVIRHGHGAGAAIADFFNEFPPTVYFLDGTTVVGRVAYTLDRVGPSINPNRIVSFDWPGVDITAETAQLAAARGGGELSVHRGLVDWLAARPRRGTSRWIVLNDGAGEIADILVIEPLPSGEVHLGLWHAKASASRTPARRINELQVVVAQAIRSRRWFTSLNLWPELAQRLGGQAKPDAILQDGSDDITRLLELLELAEVPEDGFISWIQRPPLVRGEIAVVQPGLSRQAALDEPNDGTQAGVMQLMTVLEDTASADGHEVIVLGSP
ncbi:MAG: DEAD/DEAH box helicase family protein [Dehalococcoidia bacterium]